MAQSFGQIIFQAKFHANLLLQVMYYSYVNSKKIHENHEHNRISVICGAPKEMVQN